MGFLDKMMGSKEEIDIEDFLNNLDAQEEDVYADADALVKPISMENDEDVKVVCDELRKGNILLLNIANLSKRNALKLRDLISQVKTEVESINGDIARISTERVLVTPSKVKIVKRKD
ncbi:MAG: cell division protein SepF [Candidatus Diapherotrites archaeon]|nr:cell division protein SepF [Candidatus Diapherotrites archaeon]